jgi:hypothetical protein
MARPSKLTPEVQAAVVEGIKAGNYGEVAAGVAGIGARTYYRWLRQGCRSKRGRFWQFWQAIKKAEAETEISHIAAIRGIAQGGELIDSRTVTRTHRDGTQTVTVTKKYSQPQWTALAWILEGRHAERWGRKETRQIAEMEERLKILEKNARRKQASGAGPTG